MDGRNQEPSTEEGTAPPITTCVGGPETTVFIEDGNTDGWIASDVTVEIDE